MTDSNLYPPVIGDPDADDGTMPENVETFADAIIGHRIVSVEKNGRSAKLTLDNGNTVEINEDGDCCAFTDLDEVIEHLPSIDHIVTAVRPSGDYTEWHILADFGDIMTLKVDWSPGNAFYYGYGFNIRVTEPR